MSEAERAHSFVAQSVGRRAAIVVAGPLANFILAIVIFASVFAFFGRQVTSARVDQVVPGSAAEAAGIKPGDRVVAIDGRPIESFSQMQRIVSTNAGRTLTITVDRGGVREDLKAAPKLQGFCNGVLGIKKDFAPGDVRLQRVPPVDAVGVVIGRESADQLGGPARIAQVSGQAWKAGLDSGGAGGAVVALFYLAGLLSASIGFLNLFPVPLLDGGHLLFYAIEWMRGRPLSDRAQEVGFRIGLAIVVMLMIFATYNDIVHIASQWTAS
jgi:regulator of sigma E protease